MCWDVERSGDGEKLNDLMENVDTTCSEEHCVVYFNCFLKDMHVSIGKSRDT